MQKDDAVLESDGQLLFPTEAFPVRYSMVQTAGRPGKPGPHVGTISASEDALFKAYEANNVDIRLKLEDGREMPVHFVEIVKQGHSAIFSSEDLPRQVEDRA